MSRVADRRSTSNTNTRGNAGDRRRRRAWLVKHFGDGTHVACYLQRSRFCQYVLDEDTVSPDRITPGVLGGTYRRGNIQPACQPCQADQGGEIGALRKAAKLAS